VIDRVYERMMTLPIHTMRGAAVMARATSIAGCICNYWSGPANDLDWHELAVRRLIESLCVAGGVPLPVEKPKDEDEDA
jgi:hypothetical protein